MQSTRRSTYKKKGTRKTTGWLTKYKPTALAVHRPNVGLGRSLSTKMKTVFYANVVPAVSGVFTGYLNPGSCFDPAGDIAAMQPAGFDQMAAIYARYLVTGATVEVVLMPGYSNSIVPFVAAGYPSTVSTALATFQGAASQPYSQTKSHPGGGAPAVKMFWKLNTQKVVGARLPVIAEDCGALVSASPTTGQNMILPLFLQNAAAGQTPITLKVTIVQDVIFDQRIQVVDA